MSELTEYRAEKDEYFQRHPQSPLTPEQRLGFVGLQYFPENEDLRLEVLVEPAEDQEPMEMQTSTGGVQTYVRQGTFRFEVDGKEAELTIFRNEHGYFLPFVDSLANQETYGAGRYLEPEPLGSNRFRVDFNQAYNPYCAYNASYECPYPPPSNRLDVAITAGEKAPDVQG